MYGNAVEEFQIIAKIRGSGSTFLFVFLLWNPEMAGLGISQVQGLASTDSEERCPMLLENRLYFVSDRTGGQSGFHGNFDCGKNGYYG